MHVRSRSQLDEDLDAVYYARPEVEVALPSIILASRSKVVSASLHSAEMAKTGSTPYAKLCHCIVPYRDHYRYSLML
jgi:hypothetical protein